MRNLTQEAIVLAKDHLVQTNPSLASKQTREQLPDMTKQILLMQLDMLYEAYMAELLAEFQPSHASMV